jgi:hypothetical protein
MLIFAGVEYVMLGCVEDALASARRLALAVMA